MVVNARRYLLRVRKDLRPLKCCTTTDVKNKLSGKVTDIVTLEKMGETISLMKVRKEEECCS